MFDLFNRKKLARAIKEGDAAMRMGALSAEEFHKCYNSLYKCQIELGKVTQELTALKQAESTRRAKLSEYGKKGRAKQLRAKVLDGLMADAAGEA